MFLGNFGSESLGSFWAPAGEAGFQGLYGESQNHREGHENDYTDENNIDFVVGGGGRDHEELAQGVESGTFLAWVTSLNGIPQRPPAI